MTERVTFEDAVGLAGSPAQVVARIGPCSLGTPNTVYEIAGEQDALVGDAIGYGDLPAWTRRGARYGRQTCYAIPAEIDTAGSIGDVTKTGDGPTITATAVPASGDQIEGPWFSFPNLRVKISDGGPNGEARAQVLLDGVTPGDETIDIPPLLPASVTGTVDITALSDDELSDLNTKTFIDNPDGDGVKTTTFSGVTDYEDIIEQVGDSMKDAATVLGTEDLTAYTPGDINTKTFLATLTVEGVETAISVTFAAVASLANIATQIAAASGITSALETGDFISVTTDAKGADVSLVIGNGTANADLGFTNGTESTGVNSTYDIPGTGVRLTFPAGDYEEDTTYDIPVVGPRIAIAGMQAAAAALRAEGVQFAILHIVHEPADGLDLLAWQSALEEIRLGWAQAEDNPIFVKGVIGSPLGDAGVAGDLTASRAAWAANDQDVKTNLANTQIDNKFNTIVHGDAFVEFVEYSGRHRAQLAGPYVEECAGYPLNINPGLGSKGPLRAAYLKAVDGTPARTEAESTVKMQDHGFSVLRDDQSTPYIRAGRTRAPSTSQLTGEHTARAALECARVTRNRAFFYSNSTPVLGANGQLSAVDKSNIEGAFNRDLEEEIVKKGYASSARAVVLGLVSVGGTDRLYVKAVFQRLANVTGVDITIVTTNRLDIVEGIAKAA